MLSLGMNDSRRCRQIAHYARREETRERADMSTKWRRK
jgi:hypothetical protein